VTDDELRAGGFTIASCDDTFYGSVPTDVAFELNP
jgi:hypothetical protein